MSDNTFMLIFTALCSGLVATLVTIWWQNKAQKKADKLRIFTTLMSQRYEFTSEDCVNAFNMIDVVFYTSDKVRNAWKEFNDATQGPENESKNQIIYDKFLRLLEIMAEDVGYGEIRWDNIKNYYYPVGLSEKRREEAVLRQLQINANMAQLQSEEQTAKSAQVDKDSELAERILLEGIKNPDGLLKFMEAAEKAQALNKPKKKK